MRDIKAFCINHFAAGTKKYIRRKRGKAERKFLFLLSLAFSSVRSDPGGKEPENKREETFHQMDSRWKKEGRIELKSTFGILPNGARSMRGFKRRPGACRGHFSQTLSNAGQVSSLTFRTDVRTGSWRVTLVLLPPFLEIWVVSSWGIRAKNETRPVGRRKGYVDGSPLQLLHNTIHDNLEHSQLLKACLNASGRL